MFVAHQGFVHFVITVQLDVTVLPAHQQVPGPVPTQIVHAHARHPSQPAVLVAKQPFRSCFVTVATVYLYTIRFNIK